MPIDDLGVLFTRAMAQGCGYSAGQIRHRIQNGQWSVVVGPVLTLGVLEITPRLRDRAAVLALPDGVLSGASAARWHGLDVGDPRTWITVPQDLKVRMRGIRVRRERLDPADRVVRHGLVITSLERTIFDCVRAMPPDKAERLLLQAFDEGWISYERFLKRVQAHVGRHGMAHLLMLVSRARVAIHQSEGRFAPRHEPGRPGSMRRRRRF